MKILLVGGSGYIGSELRKKLKVKHEVTNVDMNLFGGDPTYPNQMDYGNLEDDFMEKFDVIILTAAHSSVPMCNGDPDGAFLNNVSSCYRFIRNIHPSQKLIYASSSCVYVETGERLAEETDKIEPVDMLSFSKSTIDNYLRAFNPCEWYSLRFGSVNGWSENFRTDLMINAMTLNAIKDGYLKVFNGDSYRPILGMKDLVRAVESIVDSKEDNRGIYNIASFNTNINTIANKISEITGCTIKEEQNTKSYNFRINSEKFKKTFNVDLVETPESIIKSIIENKEILTTRSFPLRAI
jgi:nucleoside-diphosphate-sugar epimerase